MTRARHPMNNAIRKKMDKEVKKAEKDYAINGSAPESAALTPPDMLKKYPQKIMKTRKSLLSALKKNVEIKHTKAKSSHHKRTTPGSIDGQPSAPASVKVEGARWDKTLKLQNKIKNKTIVHKLNKQK